MGQPNPTADPGATPPKPSTPATDPPPTATEGDDPRAAYKKLSKDLERERAERQTLQSQLKELQERDPVKAIAEALGVKPAAATGDDLAATVKQMQRELADERLGRIRLEVAAEKGLTPAQAKRLQGATREELAADAEDLLETFKANGSTTPSGTPAPDPSQGARGGANALEAQLKAAQDKGDTKEAIRLKNLLAEARKAK